MRLHHVGYVVESIARFAEGFPGLSHLRTVEDPRQAARLAIYEAGGGALVEFVEPLGPEAPTWRHLQARGSGPHHVCYEGVPREELEAVLRDHRMVRVLGPLPATLFGRDVAFAVTRARAVVEFLL